MGDDGVVEEVGDRTRVVVEAAADVKGAVVGAVLEGLRNAAILGGDIAVQSVALARVGLLDGKA